jgi:galactosylceramidase
MKHGVAQLSLFEIDVASVGPPLDGIGAISGGGATSRLLIDYPEPQRGDILDLMFKPYAGGNLQVLKVEIGGGAQTSDGSEATHMITEDDEDYTRGYEFWLMTEALARNPKIRLLGLPWSWPAWVQPFTDISLPVKYVVNWVSGAKRHHGLDIYAVGIWNEDPTSDTYVIALRKGLDDSGFRLVKIVYTDAGQGWPLPRTKAASEAVEVLGSHYPGTHALPSSETIASGKVLWASEDSPTPDFIGSCWARIVNQNFAVANITSTLMWNLVNSYYQMFPFGGRGMMTAIEPWSGHYETKSSLFVTAHTTWFTEVGSWHYLTKDRGSGQLQAGGSYVSLVDPITSELTIVIEKMAWESTCHGTWYPKYFPSNYVTANETARFCFVNATTESFAVWYSHFEAPDVSTDPLFNQSTYLKRQHDVVVDSSGCISIDISINSMLTITSRKNSIILAPRNAFIPDSTAGLIPPTGSLLLPYNDGFEPSGGNRTEAKYWSDIAGFFQLMPAPSGIGGDARAGTVMQQMLPAPPVPFHSKNPQPVTLMGQHWPSVNVSIDFWIAGGGSTDVFSDIPNSAALCVCCSASNINDVEGMWVLFYADSRMGVATSASRMKAPDAVKPANVTVGAGHWHHLEAACGANALWVKLDGKVILAGHPVRAAGGFVGLGSASYSNASFDNFAAVEFKPPAPAPTPPSAPTPPPAPTPTIVCKHPYAGQPVNMSTCQHSTATRFKYQADITIQNAGAFVVESVRRSSGGSLCFAKSRTKCTKHSTCFAELAPCNNTDPMQLFHVDTTHGTIVHVPSSLCLDECVDAWSGRIDFYHCKSTPHSNQQYSFNGTSGQIRSAFDGRCVVACF